MTTYETKDSGFHQEYESGMRRDSQDGKPRFDLIRTKLQPYEEQMITRYARLLARGAEKYSARNWEEGCGEEELERAKASLLRHTEQLVAGETDEDHAAAVWFNTQAIEYFRWRLETPDNDGLTGAERLAKAARASEINQLALRKAAEMRRRERLKMAAKEIDNPIIDMNEDGTPFRKSDLDRNRQSGAVGLFQFVPGDWSAYQEKLGHQIAESIQKRYGSFDYSAPLAHYSMRADGQVTDNRTGRVVAEAISAEGDEAHASQPELPYDEMDQN
jgi:hypothetical protein